MGLDDITIFLERIQPYLKLLTLLCVFGLAFWYGMIYQGMLDSQKEAEAIYLGTQGKGVFNPDNRSYTICDMEQDHVGKLKWICQTIPMEEYDTYWEKKQAIDDIIKNMWMTGSDLRREDLEEKDILEVYKDDKYNNISWGINIPKVD